MTALSRSGKFRQTSPRCEFSLFPPMKKAKLPARPLRSFSREAGGPESWLSGAFVAHGARFAPHKPRNRRLADCAVSLCRILGQTQHLRVWCDTDRLARLR